MTAFIEISRPFTMVAAMVAGVCIVLLYSTYYGMAFSWGSALSAVILMVSGVVYFFAMNRWLWGKIYPAV